MKAVLSAAKEIIYPRDTIAPDNTWPQWLTDEFASNTHNGYVGARLLAETDKVRIWHILLEPGQRLPVHKHVLNYFWTVTHPGRGQSHYHDGTEVTMAYEVGQTVHHSYGPGEFMMHDLNNIGDTRLGFTTVEFLDSPNAPLPL
jgi:beta-alanine degradation protein BauB